MTKFLKRPLSVLLSALMIVSLFAAVPMTVNAAPPGGSDHGGIETEIGGTEIGPVHVSAGFDTQPYAIEGLVANGSEQALISAGTTADGATAYYYMTTEDITGEQANSLFNSPSKPGSFSTEIPKGRDAGTYYVWYAIDGGSNYADLLPYMEINDEYESHKLTVTIAAPEFYIVGIGGDWNTLKDEYKLTKNPNNDAEYMFEGLTVGANTELKVKGTNTYYYPDGTGNNFTLVDAGTYDIYFRPDGQGGEGWWYGDIYATPSAPAPVTYTEVPAKEADIFTDGNIQYYVGSDGKYYTKSDETYTEITQAQTVVPALANKSVDVDNSDSIAVFNGFSNYIGARFLGFQQGALNGEDTKASSLRFVTEVSSDILKKLNADANADYGYVFAAVKADGEADYNNLTVDHSAAHKYSCKGTTNTAAGNFGDINFESTDYKYVTAAINDIPNPAKLVARFYITYKGETYYANYADGEATGVVFSTAAYFN